MGTTPIYGLPYPDGPEPPSVAKWNKDLADKVEGTFAGAGLVGQVVAFAGATAPGASWAVCDGAPMSKATYPELWAAIEYTYGGAADSFNLPNLVGQAIAGVDSSRAATHGLGKTTGIEESVISATEMPEHSHTIAHTHTVSVSGGTHNHGIRTSGGSGGGTQYTLMQNEQNGNFTAAAVRPNEGAHSHSGSTAASSAASSGTNGGADKRSNMQPTMYLTQLIRILP